MRKILFVLLCFLIACLIFVLVVFLLNRRPEKGALQITSNPKADVYINDKLMGKSPLCLCEGQKMLDVGEYTVRLVPVEGNFEPFQRKINITAKVLTVVDRTFSKTAMAQASIISLLPIEDKKDAQISILSFPSNAEVFLDSNLSGQTPLVLKNITESDHEIKITREGYKDKIVRIRTVLGYKLEAVVYLGIDPEVANSSAVPISSKSATPIVPVVPTKPTVLILETPTGFLRVRDTASLGGSEIAQIKPGETYDLVGEQTNWFEIKLKNGINGWISSQYAKKQN